MRLNIFIAVLAFSLSSCSQLKVKELPDGEVGLKPLVLGQVEFKGGATVDGGDTFSDRVSVFPGEIVRIGCTAVNASQGEITFSGNSGQTPSPITMDPMTFPDCSKTEIDTTGWRPGIYTASVDISDSQGNTKTNTFVIEVKPRVYIQNVVVSGGNATLELYYPYGVGNGTLTINGNTVSPFPTDFNENSAYTHQNITVPLSGVTNGTFVAGVTMNGVSGPDDTHQLSNRAPTFNSSPGTPDRTFVGCKNIGQSDFSGTQITLGDDGHTTANWTWNSAGSTVTQTVNNDPSAILTNNATPPFSVQGLWKTTSGDDDFWGFVFGYKSRGNYFYSDWKKGTQAYGTANGLTGARIRKVTSSGGILPAVGFWDDADAAEFNTVKKTPGVAWQNNTNYAFDLRVNTNSLRIMIREEGTSTLLVDQTHSGDMTGKWGLYTFSQTASIYSGMRACSVNGPTSAYQYTPSASDPDGDPLTFSKIAGPPGLVVSPTTGRITWLAPTIGSYAISIRVSDSRGGSDTLNYSLVVSSPF